MSFKALLLFLCVGTIAADLIAFPSITWEAEDRGVPFLNHFSQESGNWTATCDIPSFNVFNMPLSTVTYSSELISWTWPEFALSVTIHPDDTFTAASDAIIVEGGTTSYNLTYYRYVPVNRTWEAEDRGVPFLCHFAQQSNGSWTAVMDLPSYSVFNLPVDNVVYSPDLIYFHISGFNSSVYAIPDASQNLSTATGYIVETDGRRYDFTYFRLKSDSNNTDSTGAPAETPTGPPVNDTDFELWLGEFYLGDFRKGCEFKVVGAGMAHMAGYFNVPDFNRGFHAVSDLVYTTSRISFWENSTAPVTGSFFNLTRSGPHAEGTIKEGSLLVNIYLDLQINENVTSTTTTANTLTNVTTPLFTTNMSLVDMADSASSHFQILAQIWVGTLALLYM